MTPFLHRDDIVIFDDVLDSSDREALWTYVQMTDYQLLHLKGWHKDWRLHDGMPRAASPVSVRRDGAHPSDSTHFPTHTPIDLPIQSVLQSLEQVPFVDESNWQSFKATTFLYPQGSGLSWHTDNPEHYAGSFIYYAHHEWNVEWGGELMIQELPQEGVESLYAGSVMEVKREQGEIVSAKRTHILPHLDNRNQNKVLMRQGRGEFFYPVPNRLIFLRAGVPHRVTAVTPAAGMQPRISVSGFFQL